MQSLRNREVESFDYIDVVYMCFSSWKSGTSVSVLFVFRR